MAHSKEIVSAVETLAKDIKLISQEKLKWSDKIDRSVKLVVLQVEKISGSWKGEDKKALAMAIILDVWEKYLNIKRLHDFIEKPLVRWAADKAIEAAVSLFNRTGVFSNK